MINRLTSILFLLFLGNILFAQDFRSEEDREKYHQLGKRTAKQTWWFFDARLKDNTAKYKYFRVSIESKGLWLKDIKQTPDGNYEGSVDIELPYNENIDVSAKIAFTALEIDDWLMVDDYYLIGGFSVRIKPFDEQKVFLKKGQYRTNCPSTNEDFFAESKIVEMQNESNFANRFIHGSEGFNEFIEKTLYFSEYAKAMGIQGYVSLSFDITSEGIIQNIKVIRGIGGGINDIAKDMLYATKGQWKPIEYSKTMNYSMRICFKFNPTYR